MKPCAFQYFAPGTVREAVRLLTQHEAKILAGGQSLVPIMNFRLARPEALIDINGIKELDYVREDGGELTIGALTRQRDVEISPLVRRKCPLLAEAILHVGHATIRNRGTIGGSLVHADPSAEIPLVVTALDGSLKAIGPEGEAMFKPRDFFVTYLTTALDPAQVLAEVRIPTLAGGTGWSFLELSRRAGDFAIVAVAVTLRMNGSTCKEARIALGGVAPTPVRATQAEEALAGEKVAEKLIEQAAKLAIEATDAESDYHASADYRRDMTRVLVRRALQEALAKARGGK
jgi:CO/xanthine dehydrogenase FAD-binding subunit